MVSHLPSNFRTSSGDVKASPFPLVCLVHIKLSFLGLSCNNINYKFSWVKFFVYVGTSTNILSGSIFHLVPPRTFDILRWHPVKISYFGITLDESCVYWWMLISISTTGMNHILKKFNFKKIFILNNFQNDWHVVNWSNQIKSIICNH